MATSDPYKHDFFNVTFPAEHVAHVEINRPNKLNAFKEVYVSFPANPARWLHLPNHLPQHLHCLPTRQHLENM
jgi:hypothetical protein